MEEVAAVVILLTVIVYLIVRVLLFANVTRRNKEVPAQDKEEPPSS